VAGTLHLNRKNVPPTVKNAKLKKGEVISQQSNGVMVIKWEDKKDVTMISIFHDEILRTLCLWPCVQPANEWCRSQGSETPAISPGEEKGSKWYMKLFRRLLNVTVHNALIVYNSQNATCDHFTFRLELITSIFEHYA
jgi:hypothetical protein